jgi:DNA-binding transcriptional ArsR family regulator
MKTQEAAHCLAELGNVTRLQIYRLLVKAGKNGLSVGDIQLALNIPWFHALAPHPSFGKSEAN